MFLAQEIFSLFLHICACNACKLSVSFGCLWKMSNRFFCCVQCPSRTDVSNPGVTCGSLSGLKWLFEQFTADFTLNFTHHKTKKKQRWIQKNWTWNCIVTIQSIKKSYLRYFVSIRGQGISIFEPHLFKNREHFFQKKT